MHVKRSIFLFALTVCQVISALGLSGAAALESKKLANGLELFIEEDHVVPLVTIRITFRAGAIVETPDLNGLCHLYEHMLFKGNALYPSQEAFKAALKRMGVGSWNGGTSTEYVTYFITIPSESLSDGLRFWAAAVQSPLLRKDELLLEREVVHNEIAGDQSKPEYALRMTMITALYPEHWYRRDVGGDLAVIDTATVEKLRRIKESYYVPNNAALFISGDVDPEQVLRLVKKYFGDWKPGSGFPDLEPHAPLAGDLWRAVANSPTRGIANVSFTFRGPDAGIDTASTYAADVWGQMVNDPGGKFKNALGDTVPGLFGGTRYIQAGYFTQRDAGTTAFSFQIEVSPDESLWDTIVKLRNAVKEEIARMVHERRYFLPEHFASAKQELENHDILSREKASGYLANLSFWWASTSTDYYLSYLDRIAAVSTDDVRGFLETYLLEKPFLTTVWIHPADDRAHGVSGWVAELNALRNEGR